MSLESLRDSTVSGKGAQQKIFGEVSAEIIDCSTNGTYLNGLRLPPKTTGKVLLSHGDELLLQDPNNGDQESASRSLVASLFSQVRLRGEHRGAERARAGQAPGA